MRWYHKLVIECLRLIDGGLHSSFILGKSGHMCVGALVGADLGLGSNAWVVGERLVVRSIGGSLVVTEKHSALVSSITSTLCLTTVSEGVIRRLPVQAN